MNENLEFLEGTEVEEFVEKKGQLTLDNPENDWSEKEIDMIGGVE